MTEPFLPYAKQDITDEDIQCVLTALKSDVVTRGAEVQGLEQEFAEYCGAEYAVAFNSGSSALAACYHTAKIDARDRVLTSPNTFISSVSAAIAAGARIVFVDVDPASGLLNLEHLHANIAAPQSRGKTVILPVHYAGATLNIRALEFAVKDVETIIIEDAAHALGARYPTGERVGSCCASHMTIFSMHPAKHITTGEGGMVTTNDLDLYRHLCLYRNNFLERDSEQVGRDLKPWEYEIRDVSGNFHMTEFQAALGRSQFSRIEDNVRKRRKLISQYRRHLPETQYMRLLANVNDANSAHHLCVALIDFEGLGIAREDAMHELREVGIGTQVHYVPLYRQPLFTDHALAELEDYFPGAERFYARALSLPLFPQMTEADVKRVAAAVRNLSKAPA